MEFQIDCPCGQKVTVNEGAADGMATCVCGRSVPVPALTELRVRAGLSPYHVSPELVIEHLLAAREIPWGQTCVRCGAATEELAEVVTDCERAWTKEVGTASWPAMVFATLFMPMWAWVIAFQRGEERQYGKDKIYPLPLPICGACRPQLSSPKAVKDCLTVVPEYRHLLAKFPNAKVQVSLAGSLSQTANEPQDNKPPNTSIQQ